MEKSMKNIEGLRAASEELKECLKKSDTERLSELISGDYRGFSLNGTVETKKEIIDCYAPGKVVITEYSVEDVHYEISGELGIVSGKGFIAGSFNEYKFSHNVLFTDIFKYEGNSWKYYRSHETEIKS